MKIIYDIDCLLYFLKIKRTDLLEELFSHIVISNKVFNSLNNPSIPDFIKDKLNDLVDKEFVKVEEISYNTKTFGIRNSLKLRKFHITQRHLIYIMKLRMTKRIRF